MAYPENKPSRLPRRALATLALLIATVSCASFPETVPRTNILMASPEGLPQDPGDRGETLDVSEYDAYIDRMLTDLGESCRGKRPCKVLFFFHGGLNTRAASVSRAARLSERIERSGSYPIFVNWNSSFPSTWWDHVARVRKGLWTGNRFVLTFPYFAAVDEVRSIAEAPVAWLAEVRHTVARYGPDHRSVQAYIDLLRNGGPNGVQVNDIADGDSLADDRRRRETVGSYSTLPLTLPTKILAPPLLIQAAGPGAWDIMQRRTAMLFRTEGELRGVPPDEIARQRVSPAATGRGRDRSFASGAALAHFITRFQRDFVEPFCSSGTYTEPVGESAADPVEQRPRVSEDTATPSTCEGRLELTLVGHSMGALIVTELLRYAPNLEVENIVFLAAATTVNDYRNTVLPYLGRHPRARMYHLVLHPLAEVSERGFLDLSPRGSLLVWIDNYFTNPITPLDRRVGRFSNLLPELLFTEDLEGRVFLKVFRIGSALRCWNPQKHGDFGLFPFWDPRFWDPSVPTTEQAPYARWDAPTRCEETDSAVASTPGG